MADEVAVNMQKWQSTWCYGRGCGRNFTVTVILYSADYLMLIIRSPLATEL